MIQKLTLIFIVGITSLKAYSQSTISNWKDIVPQTNVLGKLVQSEILSGDPISDEFIYSETSADNYANESQRHFTAKFVVSSFDNLKFLSIGIQKMKVDYLSDSVLYNNDLYLNNNFVYKALRADTVKLFLKKTIVANFSPTDLIKKSIVDEVKKAVPAFDSLKLAYQNKDSLVIDIVNPKVYFKVMAIKLTKSCSRCRMSWGVANNTPNEKTFILDITKIQKRNLFLTLPFANNPRFYLKLKQDPSDATKILLEFEQPVSFAKSNKNRLPQKFFIEYEDFLQGNVTKRQYNANSLFLGTMKTNTSPILGAAQSLDLPVYLSITAEQISPTQIQILNIADNNAIISKIEYPKYTYSVYSGAIR